MEIDVKTVLNGVRSGVEAEKLEKALRTLIADVKKVKPMKESRADLEVAIIKAENLLGAIEEVRKIL